jgi:hypothetical protein
MENEKTSVPPPNGMLVIGTKRAIMFIPDGSAFYGSSLLEAAMGTKDKSFFLIVGYLGITLLIQACAGIAVGSSNVEAGSLHLDNGVVEIMDENGDWTPVAGDSAFDVTAELESTDPWKVAGVTLETNESTRIEEGLQVGDLVRVRGIILEDGTWLANSIERAAEQVDPIIILIGRVDSVEPWVVNGIELNVTEDTDIQGTITPGMFVRVEILLSPDGAWEVLSITPLGEFEEDPDCGVVVATVVSVEGNEIQLTGWPVVTLGEDVQIESDEGGEGTLSPNQVVLIMVCPSGEGQIVIVQIIIIVNTGDDGTPPVESGEGGGKVLICHKPDKKGGHTLSIPQSAVPAHLGHGDKLGACR